LALHFADFGMVVKSSPSETILRSMASSVLGTRNLTVGLINLKLLWVAQRKCVQA
jgi:hypothetical protein